MTSSGQQGHAPRRTYVLVHGGWYGGWVWQEVAHRLRAAGHTVTTPTLTGLGERSHHTGSPVDLETHIADVTAHIRMEDLTDIVLVGWSYGGMVITGVRARMPERIASMVYLDAFVPEKGKAANDYISPATRELALPLRASGRGIPPKSCEEFGVTDPAIMERLLPRLADQPVETFFQPLADAADIGDTPHTYIRATGFVSPIFDRFYEERRDDPRWDVTKLDVGHVLMATHPALTADLLAEVR
jgi:pimeloyl-ACP methyl ester carboxylesterase